MELLSTSIHSCPILFRMKTRNEVVADVTIEILKAFHLHQSLFDSR